MLTGTVEEELLFQSFPPNQNIARNICIALHELFSCLDRPQGSDAELAALEDGQRVRLARMVHQGHRYVERCAQHLRLTRLADAYAVGQNLGGREVRLAN